MATCKTYATLSGIGIDLIVGVVAACILFPPAAIVAAIISAANAGAVAGVGTLVKGAVDNALVACDKYEDVNDMYVTIRTYGTQL